MNSEQFNTSILPKLLECQKLIESTIRCFGGDNVVVLIENQGMYEDVLYALHRILRKLPANKKLNLVLESHGGSIDAASTISSLCRERFGSLRVIAPFMAKSAAALVVLAADERLFTCSTQLGPVDPQVRHPEKRNVWFPAHSIKEALAQVEATKDNIVKAAMADKLDPFLIGSYNDAIEASTQYVQEAVAQWKIPDKDKVVLAFTGKYRSHGYPIDRKILQTLNVPFKSADAELENIVLMLSEICYDILNIEVDEGAIIMTSTDYIFRAGDFRQVGVFVTSQPIPATSETIPCQPDKE